MINLIFIDKKQGLSKTFRLRKSVLTAVLLSFFAIPLVLGGVGYYFAYLADDPVFKNELSLSTARIWQERVQQQQDDIHAATQQSTAKFQALTVRMAEMQARLVRLDALGERLLDVAEIHGDEFTFSGPPPLGGPHDASEINLEVPEFVQVLSQVDGGIREREQQLHVLARLMDNHRLEEAAFLAGRPIRRGWLSSRYGQRSDPFTGKQSWHAGVDFAAEDGSDIVATASGIVTRAGRASGYGLMIEVNHGDGFATRYAHARELLVSVGDVVRVGQAIGRVGNTGRSTGPHVHYEVLKSGRKIDPANYISRRR